MDSHAFEVAETIMALVDECPSEPLSFERKQIILRLEEIFTQYTHEVENQSDIDFSLGYDSGYAEGYSEAREEFMLKIAQLSETISELENDVRASYDEGFTDGRETLRAELGY